MMEKCIIDRKAMKGSLCPAGRFQGVVSGRRRAVRVFAASNIMKLDTGAWVVAPRYRSKGIVHFLGGAFAGAAPQVVYSLILDSIAAAGYTAIATPYAVTFRHDECARRVRRQFEDSLSELRSSNSSSSSSSSIGLAGSDVAPLDVPLFGVGHSNGSLLHMLIGSYFPGAANSNIIMSYNNKQVKDAIPVPGLMDNLPGALRAARAAAPPLPDLTAVDGGATDFQPSPAESRTLISRQYGTAATLLVRFADDSIDESAEIAALLQPRLAGGVTLLTLPGNHLTPCGGELPVPLTSTSAGGGGGGGGGGGQSIFTPAEVVVQALKEQQQADIQRLCRQIVGWMDAIATR
ncbi:hypothetical protein VOLCADRAFT_72563 [Volvox carteri f. nagariensis]|uniref:Uncharacterized protein n=1 Tax=Volvox carteri f. nagariensis TaxID=3068 RepID=D8TIN5_VOLCA|nr:uncharacterized protein VOLCADRAFT_72563 [Volvox carteri f. nagariensis]EFJ53275.1 hypothetical protein VOLCADRAFT_72563 [Volvox carteri f. nagariensis]|eukprot:XP_002946280.1 hypothetical protein VOLCADRAFT_72563 [Volvox carteri f. nagariensis]